MFVSGEGDEVWVETVVADGGLCVWSVCDGVDEDTVVLGDKVGELVVNSSFEPVLEGIGESVLVPAGVSVVAGF